jgi:hypothetical protein
VETIILPRVCLKILRDCLRMFYQLPLGGKKSPCALGKVCTGVPASSDICIPMLKLNLEEILCLLPCQVVIDAFQCLPNSFLVVVYLL